MILAHTIFDPPIALQSFQEPETYRFVKNYDVQAWANLENGDKVERGVVAVNTNKMLLVYMHPDDIDKKKLRVEKCSRIVAQVAHNDGRLITMVDTDDPEIEKSFFASMKTLDYEGTDVYLLECLR